MNSCLQSLVAKTSFFVPFYLLACAYASRDSKNASQIPTLRLSPRSGGFTPPQSHKGSATRAQKDKAHLRGKVGYRMYLESS